MVLIRASHPGQRTRGSRGHAGHLKMRNRKKMISFDYLIPLRIGGRFDFF